MAHFDNSLVRPASRELAETRLVLDDTDAGGEQQRVRRSLTVCGVVDVHRIDTDECCTLVHEPGGACPGEEVPVLGVGRRAEPGVVAGVEQDCCAAHIQGGERAGIDPVPGCATHPHDHRRQVDGVLQADGAEVGAVRVAVIGSVEVSAGIPDESELVDGELGAAARR
jgi:hypothetical protein